MNDKLEEFLAKLLKIVNSDENSRSIKGSMRNYILFGERNED